MSKCSQCGNPVPDHVKFCPNCGSPVQGQSENAGMQPEEPVMSRPEAALQPEAAPIPEAASMPETAPIPEAAPMAGPAAQPELSPQLGAAPQFGAAPQPGAAPQLGSAPQPGAAPHPGAAPQPGPAPGSYYQTPAQSQPAPQYQQVPPNYGRQEPGGTASLGGVNMTETQLMVWSIIDLLCCCLPLGVVGLVFTLTAKNELSPEGRNKKLRLAAILNIVGTVVGLVVYLFWFMVKFE